MKRNLSILILFVAVVAMMASCKKYKRKPGKVYAPDMFYSQAFDYYNGTDRINEAGGTFNKMPAKGSIAREHELPNYIGEFDTIAAKSMKNPFALYANDLVQGKRMYMIHCGICHGAKLDGQGPLYVSGKFAAMPANLKGPAYINMSEGKMYHAIMYGKNMMGAYGSQLDARQRWQVIAYIKSIQAENGGAEFNWIQERPKEEAHIIEEGHPDALMDAAHNGGDQAEATPAEKENHDADGSHANDHDEEGSHEEGDGDHSNE